MAQGHCFIALLIFLVVFLAFENVCQCNMITAKCLACVHAFPQRKGFGDENGIKSRQIMQEDSLALLSAMHLQIIFSIALCTRRYKIQATVILDIAV